MTTRITKARVSASFAPLQTTAPADDEVRWRAIETRDAAHDGRFVYGVVTTGVYCRPSCPSRRPHRANVRFFAEPAAAQAGGFRACRRCRPRAAAAEQHSAAELAVAEARAWLEAHPDEPVTLATLARTVGLSPHHLQRTFTRVVGVSPRRFQAALRADRFRASLREGQTVSRASFEAGYGASSRAYEAAEAHLGMTPAAYRQGGRGVGLRYVVSDTPIGVVLLAASARGLCAVMLGDDAAQVERALAEEFPSAAREAVDAGSLGPEDVLGGWLSAVRARLAGKVEDEQVVGRIGPIDLQGTPMQRRVWDVLRTIPPGETRTYAQVAAAAGAPRAVRAVANACARNRLALVIPCHRVIRSDGSPGEYRWGADRKRGLLRRESAVAVRRVSADG